MADVFVSHASADRDAAAALAETVRSAGLTVFWDDDLMSGQRYHETLTGQLNTARAVVVLWTPRSVRSDWVYSEARRSNDQGKLVQVRTPDVSIDDLPAPFDAYHCALWDETAGIVRAVSALVEPGAARQDQPSIARREPASGLATLPPLLTPTVGREEDLTEIAGHLAGSDRLITLTGPGGTGKTRLAVEVAQRTAGSFPDGVWFVPLETVTSGDTAWSELARTLDLPPAAHTSEGVLDHLAARRLLLVLDNVEQLPDIGDVVHQLLTGTAHVSVLATSRAAIHVTGEREHQLLPLAEPAAVQLFVQQAGRVSRGFALTDRNAHDVASICSALDGLPLAIELAAARLKLMPPSALLARLDQALDLASGERDRPDRQHTLRETIEWSFRLLSADQQALLGRLSVFSGTFDFEAIEAVSVAMGGEADCFEIVSALVDASLVRPSAEGDEPRFVLLNTVRMFGMQRLRETRALDDCTRAHAQHFVSRAIELRDRSLAGEPTRAEVVRDAANYRAVLDALPLSITGPDEPDTPMTTLQVVAVVTRLFASAWMLVETRDRLLTSFDRFRSEADALGRSACLAQLGWVQFELGERRAGLERLQQAVSALGDSGPSRPRSTPASAWWASPLYLANSAYSYQGQVLMALEDFDGAQQAARSILDSGTDRREHLSTALFILMGVAQLDGRFDEAEQLLLEQRELDEAAGDQNGLAGFEVSMADLDWCRGREDETRARLAASAERVIATDDLGLIYPSVVALALAIGVSNPSACATGLGAAHAAEERHGFSYWDTRPERTQEIIQQVRDELGQSGWDDARAAGMEIDLPTMLMVLRTAASDVTSR